MKPKKCWYCAYLAKCDTLMPCESFKEYSYNSKKIYNCSIKGKLCIKNDFYKYLAKLENTCVSTIRKYLKNFDWYKTVLKYEHHLQIVKTKDGYNIL